MRNGDAGERVTRGKKRQEEAENEAGSIERPEHNGEKRGASECVRLRNDITSPRSSSLDPSRKDSVAG